MIQKTLVSRLKNINILCYIIILVSIFSCKNINVNYDKKIKKFLDKNKINYKIDNEGDFILSKNISEFNTEIIIRSKLNTYKRSKTREMFSIVQIFDENQKTMGELAESFMIDSYNNRVMGSWEIIHDSDKGNNSLAYVIKVEENSGNTFLLDAIEEIASTVTIFKKIIQSRKKETKDMIKEHNIPSNKSENNENHQKKDKDIEKNNSTEYSDEEKLEKIKAK